MAKIYLAGPMRGHPVETAMKWRFDLSSDLAGFDHRCLIPGMAEGIEELEDGTVLSMPTEPGERIVKVDFHLVASSDYVVANLGYSFKMPTGTLAEISWAYALDIPVVVIGDNEYTQEPFVLVQSTLIVPTVADVPGAMKMLEGQWN